MEKLVSLVNEELQGSSINLRQRLDRIDAELRDIEPRLSRLYEALETGKLELNDIAPRIKELRSRQDEHNKAMVQMEADPVLQSVNHVDMAVVKAYARDLKALLGGADYVERKAFLRSFVRRIEVNKNQVTIRYKLPAPHGKDEDLRVLPIDTLGGPKGTFATPKVETFFDLTIGTHKD